jgi:hypothetical protein
MYERVSTEERGVDWHKENNVQDETHAIHGGALPLITDEGKKLANRPAFRNPRITWKIPLKKTASRKASNVPSVLMESKTTTVNPAAGPLTLTFEPLSIPTTIPPTIPAIIPENAGAPEANAMPKQSGKATRKTTKEALRSALRFLFKRGSGIIKSTKWIGLVRQFSQLPK